MAEGVENRRGGWLSRLFPFVMLIVFCAALWALHRAIAHFHFADFRDYLGQLSWRQLALAIGATLLGYSALISYDCFAMRYVRQHLATRRIAFTAFIGYAFSMNIGQAVLSGGAVRMRLYTGWGIGAGDVTRIIGFNFLIGTLGQMLTSGLLFASVGVHIPASLPVPLHSVRWLGVVLLCCVGAFFFLSSRKRNVIHLKNWRLEMPALRLSLPAVSVSAVDWMLSGIVLFALFPPDLGVPLLHFLAIVMLAHILSVLSMVPGGLGVFETVVIHLLPESISKTAALSALIAFRAIYYLIPFLLAITLLGGHEIHGRKEFISAASGKIGDWLSPFVPLLISIMIFAAGCVLLLSGATPAVGSRLGILEGWLPLGFVEFSHFMGSIVGIALLILSMALRRRVDAAWFATVILLVTGIGTSLLKGLDYEEASILAVVVLVLLPCRSRFHRQASIIAQRFTATWWVSVGLVLGLVTWIGFSAFERVHYHPDLWLHFGFRGDAARFLRASAGIATALTAFAIWQLLRPGTRTPPAVAGSAQLAEALSIVRQSPETNAWLAMLGDKRLFFSESGRSFIMFGIRGRTWVAMGDPIGDTDEHEDLIWSFRELCDAAGARLAFYQVRAESAHVYTGLGLLLYKLGEEARVDLGGFSLDGAPRRNLRRCYNSLLREGASFEIIRADRFDEVKADLRSISDAWLGEKSSGEKSFSLGSFHEHYLRNFDFAVIRVGGRIVAFANILAGGDHLELSIDLMRHVHDAPDGVMEFLFVGLMLWGKAEGYRWFNLGMAPMSGLENRALAPVWHRLGARIFVLGEHFYNFQGLRAYKEKFDPVWRPRYLACPGVVSLPVVLLDIASLIGGGLIRSIAGRAEPPSDHASESTKIT